MSVAIDARKWDRGQNSAFSIAGYIQAIGLRPEDSYGFMPSGRGARELLYVYRDRPEYAAARERYDPEQAGTSLFGGPVEISGTIPSDVAAMLEQTMPGLEIPGAAAAAPTDGAIFVHSLQWPDTRFLDGWRPVESAFATYASDVGLRPEDVYGWAPVTWYAQESHYRGFNLVYRDRPEYAEGRSRFAQRGNTYEFEESGTFPGAPAPPPAEARGGGIRADSEDWPGAGFMRKAKGERMIAWVSDRLASSGLQPEDSFGLGPDKINENFWLVYRV